MKKITIKEKEEATKKELDKYCDKFLNHFLEVEEVQFLQFLLQEYSDIINKTSRTLAEIEKEWEIYSEVERDTWWLSWIFEFRDLSSKLAIFNLDYKKIYQLKSWEKWSEICQALIDYARDIEIEKNKEFIENYCNYNILNISSM